MHREGLRALVAGAETDVPTGTWVGMQFLRYNSSTGQIDTAAAGGGGIAGTPPTVVGNVAAWNDTVAGTLVDGAKAVASLVTGPGAAVSGNLPSFSGITGKIIQDSGVSAFSVNSIVTQGVINVSGVAPSFGVALYNGVNGRSITSDANITSPAGGQLQAQRFIGPATGCREVGGPTDLLFGVIAANALLMRSGTNIISTNPALSLIPGGGLTIFPGTYVAGDRPAWNGTAWVPKFQQVVDLPVQFSQASGVGGVTLNSTGIVLSVPRAGIYYVEFDFDINISVTAVAVGVAIDSSLNPLRMMMNCVHATGTAALTTGVQTLDNTATAAAAHTTASTFLPCSMKGEIDVAGAATFTLMIQRAVNTNTLIVGAGSIAKVTEL